MRSRLVLTLVVLLLSAGQSVLAQDRMLTLDDIYDPAKRVNFGGSPPAGLTWMNDGKSYLHARRDPETRARHLMRVNISTGDATPFYDAAKMEAAFVGLPGMSREAAQSLARRGSYQMNEDQTAALINHANDLFYY